VSAARKRVKENAERAKALGYEPRPLGRASEKGTLKPIGEAVEKIVREADTKRIKD
jgi:hypothetical protein